MGRLGSSIGHLVFSVGLESLGIDTSSTQSFSEQAAKAHSTLSIPDASLLLFVLHESLLLSAPDVSLLPCAKTAFDPLLSS